MFKILSSLMIICLIQVIAGNDFSFDVTDQQAYADKLAEIDHKLQTIRQIRAYTRRY